MKISLKDRIEYRLQNILATGTWALLSFLGIITVTFIF